MDSRWSPEKGIVLDETFNFFLADVFFIKVVHALFWNPMTSMVFTMG